MSDPLFVVPNKFYLPWSLSLSVTHTIYTLCQLASCLGVVIGARHERLVEAEQLIWFGQLFLLDSEKVWRVEEWFLFYHCKFTFNCSSGGPKSYIIKWGQFETPFYRSSEIINTFICRVGKKKHFLVVHAWQFLKCVMGILKELESWCNSRQNVQGQAWDASVVRGLAFHSQIC